MNSFSQMPQVQYYRQACDVEYVDAHEIFPSCILTPHLPSPLHTHILTDRMACGQIDCDQDFDLRDNRSSFPFAVLVASHTSRR